MDRENIPPNLSCQDKTVNEESTTSKKIHQLEGEVTRKICTGQIIISLAGACRELIDNALDAGATNIEIRAKENGADYLEVVDNGSGISEENFDMLCKPHSTSKLTTLNDFNFLSTFGFRGEALNALAALSEVTITTRHTSSKIAFRLRFDRNGVLMSKDLCPRQVGTTICVVNLFGTLPVRRQEFVRNSRREFLKMLSAVQSFALSRIDCRFNCSNLTNGKKVQMLSTPGNCIRLKEVISSLFGVVKAEKGSSILDIEEAIPDAEVMALYGVKIDPNLGSAPFDEIKLSGYVSSCEFACGRNSPDRQFIYVNKRPVDFVKLNRITNEVYGHFNRGQYCMLIIFIDVDPAKLDVNVSPDKRTVFLHNEKELFAKFRASLWHTFSKIDGNCRRGTAAIASKDSSSDRTPASLKQSRSSTELDFLTQMSTDDIGGRFSRAEISFTEDMFISNDDNIGRASCPDGRIGNSPKKLRLNNDQPLHNRTQFHILDDAEKDQSNTREEGSLVAENKTLQDLISLSDDESDDDAPISLKPLEGDPSPIVGVRSSIQRTLEAFEFQPGGSSNVSQPCTSTPLCRSQPAFITAAKLLNKNLKQLDNSDHKTSSHSANGNSVTDNLPSSNARANEAVTIDEHNTSSEWTFASGTTTKTAENPAPGTSSMEEFVRPEQVLEIGSLSKFREMVFRRRAKKRKLQSEEFRCEINVTEPTQIENLTSAENGETDTEKRKAEERLNLLLRKADFSHMEVIGQFNNAFIFARLDDELFMIDQHASDEKFNFERFKRRAQISTQKLINAKPLELGAVEESVLRDNIDIFRANGFDFFFSDDAANGMRVMLASVPVLHGWQFDNSDIEEIVGVLTDFPGVMYRPAKLRKIFASRACRKSVMFGTALTKQQMIQIVRNMGTMEQPWNCPHGRPTIRHLCTIKTD